MLVQIPFSQPYGTAPGTSGLIVENLGNVLGNRTQAWSRHLKKLNHQTSNVSLGTGHR